jgi:hypothetical protein
MSLFPKEDILIKEIEPWKHFEYALRVLSDTERKALEHAQSHLNSLQKSPEKLA